MKIRQAKKILFSKHWRRYCEKQRPPYFDAERKAKGSTGWVYPSWHDIPNPTFQKARRKYFGAAQRFYDRHGFCFDYKKI